MPCLRYDFIFRCPFCLLHEGDLSEHDVIGQRLVWVEHRALQSEDEARADEYGNCFLSCAFCNSARGRKPITDEAGRTLLDPTQHAWAEHFYWNGDFLQPNRGDANAEYTWSTYNLDEPIQKVERRRVRREKIASSRSAIESFTGVIRQQLRRADKAREDGDHEREHQALREARRWQTFLEQALVDLRRWQPVPPHAPGRCACGGDPVLELPIWLTDTLSEVPDPPG